MNIDQFDLNLLRVLDTLLSERSVTKAAERLHLSQPAVSSALSRLRSAFGDQLFERKYGGLEPTAFARAIEPEVRDVMARLELTLTATKSFEPISTSRTFRLAASDYFGDFLMGPLTSRFRDLAPNGRIQLLPLDPKNHLESLERFRTDAVIFLSLPVPEWMRSKVVYQSYFRVIASSENPYLQTIAPNQQIPLDMYCKLKHGVYSPSGEVRTWMDTELSKQGKDRQVVATAPTFHSLAKTVQQSDIISTVPKAIADDFSKRYGLTVYAHPLDYLEAELMMAWHYRQDRKPEQVWFRGLITEELAKIQWVERVE